MHNNHLIYLDPDLNTGLVEIDLAANLVQDANLKNALAYTVTYSAAAGPQVRWVDGIVTGMSKRLK